MNKDQELAILAEAATKLGNASCLGPWLSSIIDELQRDLRSDFIPVITLGEARYRAQRIAIEANDKAEAHYKNVQAEAATILNETWKEASRVRDAAKSALRRAIDSI